MTYHTKAQWEIDWEKFCKSEAEKFDALSNLQRSVIAGTFEINGKSFIRQLLASKKAAIEGKLLKEDDRILSKEDVAFNAGISTALDILGE